MTRDLGVTTWASMTFLHRRIFFKTLLVVRRFWSINIWPHSIVTSIAGIFENCEKTNFWWVKILALLFSFTSTYKTVTTPLHWLVYCKASLLFILSVFELSFQVVPTSVHPIYLHYLDLISFLQFHFPFISFLLTRCMYLTPRKLHKHLPSIPLDLLSISL